MLVFDYVFGILLSLAGMIMANILITKKTKPERIVWLGWCVAMTSFVVYFAVNTMLLLHYFILHGGG